MAFCAVEEAPAFCGVIRVQDNRKGLHEKPNTLSVQSCGDYQGAHCGNRKRGERKLKVDDLASDTGNYSVLQVGKKHSDG